MPMGSASLFVVSGMTRALVFAELDAILVFRDLKEKKRGKVVSVLTAPVKI